MSRQSGSREPGSMPDAQKLISIALSGSTNREVTAGHYGTWIAHPLVNEIALQIFNENMLGPNQYHVLREDVKVASADLLSTTVPGKITDEGVRSNISTCLAYTSAWIGGNGCIPLNYLMEDAATAEIARVQLWQWVKYAARVDSGIPVTADYVDKAVDELGPTIQKLAPGVKEENVKIALEYLKGQVRKEWPSEFLTSDLMMHLAVADGAQAKWQRAAS